MNYFEYDKTDINAEYYEILDFLMANWENEIVEFKEAKGQFSVEKIGQYFSAISCEANLKQLQFGWLVLGVSEQGKRHLVGTAFKKGDVSLLEKFKHEISINLTNEMTFADIIELYPEADGKKYRVLMFKIPAAVVGIPTEWKNRCYARNGESLVPLPQFKIDAIRNQERRDWSKHILQGATIDHLDKEAINMARETYKEKMNREHISAEIDGLNDEEFLTKIRLIVDGHVTNAAMILLGNPDYDNFFEMAPSMMWRLLNTDGTVKDYEIYKIPFIMAADKLFGRIRNLTYRYMPNQLTLFPKETEQYDSWLLRELLNNCIAHSNYQLGGRIYVNECEDSIVITNPGDFLPQTIENVLQPTYNPPFYRNQLRAESMVKFHMIDTATSGIKRVFKIQQEKYFPLPDYDLSSSNEVRVTIYGKTLDENYTHILFDNPDLNMEVVFLLDKVQKGRSSELTPDAVKLLRKHHLVEGRAKNLYVSVGIAQSIDEPEKYIKNKGFDDKYYKDLIVEYLKHYGKAKKKDFRALLIDKFPDVLSESQKEKKISNLLTALKNKGIIITDSENQQKSYWILVGIDENKHS